MNHFRDTQYGHFVRFLSGKRLLRYPDEVDSKVWKHTTRHGNVQVARRTPKGNSDLEKSTDPSPPLQASTRSRGEQDVGVDVLRAVEAGKDVCLVDWYGSDDPENPQNWSSRWKAFVTFQICLINFSIYVPGERSIMKDFGVSTEVATLGLSLYTVGYGVGPMLWSPASEIPAVGRSGIYFWTLAAFVLLQLPTGFAVNMPMFLVFRTFTGFLGCPGLATGGATIADMYAPAMVAYGICIWGSFGVCGPVFGPIIGGFVAPVMGWRWTIWVITWLNAIVLALLFFCLPETSAASILYKRAKRLRKATGDHRLRSQSEIDAAHHTIKDHLIILGRAFTLTFSEPIVFSLDLYTALLYGILFLWFESFPLVFGGIYGFNAWQQGLCFLGIFVGGIITVPFFLLWIKYGIVPKFDKPWFKPEMVLPPTFFGAAALPICLFWYGWSARDSISWIMPVIGSAFFTVGIVTLFNAVLNYLGIAYPTYAASIYAGNGLFRASFGAFFPLVARQMFHKLGIGPGNSLLGGIAVCFLPLPYIFYQYGAKIRHMSKNARHDV